MRGEGGGERKEGLVEQHLQLSIQVLLRGNSRWWAQFHALFLQGKWMVTQAPGMPPKHGLERKEQARQCHTSSWVLWLWDLWTGSLIYFYLDSKIFCESSRIGRIPTNQIELVSLKANLFCSSLIAYELVIRLSESVRKPVRIVGMNTLRIQSWESTKNVAGRKRL